jgi:predicted membrane channel-forming protein YqfA (hemolysin III family)
MPSAYPRCRYAASMIDQGAGTSDSTFSDGARSRPAVEADSLTFGESRSDESLKAEPGLPRARGWIHRVSFLVAFPAGVVLVVLAPSGAAPIAVAIYALTLVAVFGVSATYHRGSWSVQDRAGWQRRDHAAIFLLIAGTYTPYCTVALE